jgi:phosphoribosylformylglycinamidine synthase subunit PurSL
MAACAIDEAVRNCVAVGADPRRIAILDNFCWGYTDRPETLGALVRAALACYDVAVAYGTPFISGKDSLHNEFTYEADGERRTIQIPHTLLISALGQIEDVSRCVTMDLKAPGNLLYQVGVTKNELGGSHWEIVRQAGVTQSHSVPQVDASTAKRTFAAVHEAIQHGLVRACHDLSEGGLAVALAEMAFAGGCGARVRLAEVPHSGGADPGSDDFETVLLFSETASRFLAEVPPAKRVAFEAILRRQDVSHVHIGEVTDTGRVEIAPIPRPGYETSGQWLIDLPLVELKEAWQRPLRW